eukprot:Blabericola_migrator_1__8821@NODE_465_length_8250_cov_107_590737_g363_i0_p1_GENE_NODE_465_length_8250_cov_107_590737_g363_i0NODE_465_length_8250_cov_107_590737_g363_i0_p1_ORF_typecomplete_len868_score143_74Get5_C/PF18514_1/0_3_NODE_465_length_8250_cov_107_590737_g363_i046437246
MKFKKDFTKKVFPSHSSIDELQHVVGKSKETLYIINDKHELVKSSELSLTGPIVIEQAQSLSVLQNGDIIIKRIGGTLEWRRDNEVKLVLKDVKLECVGDDFIVYIDSDGNRVVRMEPEAEALQGPSFRPVVAYKVSNDVYEALSAKGDLAQFSFTNGSPLNSAQLDTTVDGGGDFSNLDFSTLVAVSAVCLKVGEARFLCVMFLTPWDEYGDCTNVIRVYRNRGSGFKVTQTLILPISLNAPQNVHDKSVTDVNISSIMTLCPVNSETYVLCCAWSLTVLLIQLENNDLNILSAEESELEGDVDFDEMNDVVGISGAVLVDDTRLWLAQTNGTLMDLQIDKASSAEGTTDILTDLTIIKDLPVTPPPTASPQHTGGSLLSMESPFSCSIPNLAESPGASLFASISPQATISNRASIHAPGVSLFTALSAATPTHVVDSPAPEDDGQSSVSKDDSPQERRPSVVSDRALRITPKEFKLTTKSEDEAESNIDDTPLREDDSSPQRRSSSEGGATSFNREEQTPSDLPPDFLAVAPAVKDMIREIMASAKLEEPSIRDLWLDLCAGGLDKFEDTLSHLESLNYSTDFVIESFPQSIDHCLQDSCDRVSNHVAKNTEKQALAQCADFMKALDDNRRELTRIAELWDEISVLLSQDVSSIEEQRTAIQRLSDLVVPHERWPFLVAQMKRMISAMDRIIRFNQNFNRMAANALRTLSRPASPLPRPAEPSVSTLPYPKKWKTFGVPKPNRLAIRNAGGGQSTRQMDPFDLSLFLDTISDKTATLEAYLAIRDAQLQQRSSGFSGLMATPERDTPFPLSKRCDTRTIDDTEDQTKRREKFLSNITFGSEVVMQRRLERIRMWKTRAMASHRSD